MFRFFSIRIFLKLWKMTELSKFLKILNYGKFLKLDREKVKNDEHLPSFWSYSKLWKNSKLLNIFKICWKFVKILKTQQFSYSILTANFCFLFHNFHFFFSFYFGTVVTLDRKKFGQKFSNNPFWCHFSAVCWTPDGLGVTFVIFVNFFFGENENFLNMDFKFLEIRGFLDMVLHQVKLGRFSAKQKIKILFFVVYYITFWLTKYLRYILRLTEFSNQPKNGDILHQYLVFYTIFFFFTANFEILKNKIAVKIVEYTSQKHIVNFN